MEFIGRESAAYLGYLYCRAEWWSLKDWNLTKFRSYGMSKRWREMNLGLGKEFGLLFVTLWESGIFFSHFQLFLFLEESALSFAEMILILWSFMMRRPCMGWLGILWRLWVYDSGGMVSGGGCQSRTGWLTDQTFEASKRWVYEGNRSADGMVHFLDGRTVRQSSW